MPLLGELTLWIALPVALWGAVTAFVGGARRRGDLVLSAEYSTYAVFALLLITSAGISAAFLQNRYEFWYVWAYSNQALHPYFKVAGLWAGQRGSLVFWVLILSFFSAICVWTNRKKNRELMPYATGTLLSIIVFFLLLALFVTYPFERLGMVPADGRGLNYQLQNYWMTIHPPTLYLGLTAFSVPFAFAFSALLKGRLDNRWIEATRRWTLLSWFFLTLGIVFGMRWAYEELGWGGYWFWDPVENASFLPWLLASAFLHSIQIQQKRGMLKIWNMGLVSATFLLTIFATFLTRSGLIESVHAFAQDLTISYFFLTFLGGVGGLCFLLILWRRDELRSERKIESFVSRESAFLFNNLIFVGAAFAVLWGTMLPLITEGLFGEKVSVGPPFFNRVNVPIGLVLLTLTGIGPVIAWRKASKRNLKKNFTWPLVIAGLVLAFLVVGGMREVEAGLTFVIASFVLTVTATEFWKGTQARARIEGEGAARAFYNLVRRNRRRWGGYIVHTGVVVMFAGFAGSSFDRELRAAMSPGDVVEVESPFGHTYEVRYEGLSESRPTHANIALQWSGALSVSRDGNPLGLMTAHRRLYLDDQTSTEVDIRSSFLEDFYVILASAEGTETERATFQFLVNPLVGWIWFGGLVMAVGALIALWPQAPPSTFGAERVERAESEEAEGTGSPVPAGAR